MSPLRRLAPPPDLPPDIEIWQLELDLGQPPAPEAWLDLDAGEQARARALRQPADCVRLVATHSALRRLLGQRLGRAAAALRFEAGRHGKPHLVGAPDLPFNLSHSGALALISLGSSGSLGVDIERIRPEALEPGVLDRVLTTEERVWVGADPATFFLVWTAKEALLKALGTGMSLAPHRICLRAGPQGSPRIASLPSEYATAGSRLWQLEAPPGYAAALAWIEN